MVHVEELCTVVQAFTARVARAGCDREVIASVQADFRRWCEQHDLPVDFTDRTEGCPMGKQFITEDGFTLYLWGDGMWRDRPDGSGDYDLRFGDRDGSPIAWDGEPVPGRHVMEG